MDILYKIILFILLINCSYAANKIPIPCPGQNPRLGILFVIGQSNACNCLEKKFTTKYPDKVFNYYAGQCYLASSPILGAGGTCDGGEFMTPLADELIENGTYYFVMIVAAGIPGSEIKRWEKGSEVNQSIQRQLSDISNKYQGNEVNIIWHQGEADYYAKTPGQEYTHSFNSLLEGLRDIVPESWMYYAIATYCGYPDWIPDNPVALAQRNLADSSKRIYLGADTDKLVLDEYRYDHCHFAEKGQLITAHEYAKAMRANKFKSFN